jgi:hypothetical protein
MIPSGYHKEIIKIQTISSHLVNGENHKLDLNGAHAWLLFMWALKIFSLGLYLGLNFSD